MVLVARHFHPTFRATSVTKNRMRGLGLFLIISGERARRRFRTDRFSRRRRTLGGRDGDSGRNDRASDRRREISLRRGILVVVLVWWQTTRLSVGLDEAASERSEKWPDRWDRHGNEDDPLLDLTPAEEDTDTIYQFENMISTFSRLILEQRLLTRRIITQDEASCPCSHNSCDTGKDTTTHEETQAPFQLAIDLEWGQHRDRDNGQIEIRECRDGSCKVCIVNTRSVIALTLSQGVPESVRRAALEPRKQDLRDVEDDIKRGDGDQTAADLGVFVKKIRLDRALVHPIALELGRETYCLGHSSQSETLPRRSFPLEWPD